MVLLTFTEDSARKIDQGVKCATTRRYTNHWLGVVAKVELGEDVTFQLWRGSPRNKGRPMFNAKAVRSYAEQGQDFTEDMVRKDGHSYESLAAAVYDLYQPRWCEQCAAFQPSSHFEIHGLRGKPYPREKAADWFGNEWWTWHEWEPPAEVRLVGDALERLPLEVGPQ